MKMNKKLIVATAACAALLVGSISTSLAWLMDDAAPVTNTFDPSTIGVELEETTTSYKMIPGWDISKDPKAWVTTGSEDAILFVEVTESANFDTFMTYAIAEGWTLLTDNSMTGNNIVTDGTTNGTYVIYRKVTSSNEDAYDDIGTEYQVLAGNTVSVKGGVTKEMMPADESSKPTLTFTAYAHQLYQKSGTEFNPVDAWRNLKPTT